MACLIQLLTTAAGVATEFDGLYLKEYDPSYVNPQGYDGGILVVTSDPAKAMRFRDAGEAMKKYRESFGLRPDGEPNRPLTAWTICIEIEPDGGPGDRGERSEEA